MAPNISLIRSYIRTEKYLQKRKYPYRRTIYVYKCIKENCLNEIHITKCDLKRISGRCRKCADKESGLKSSLRQRIEPYKSLYNRFASDRIKFNQSNSITFDNFLEFVKIKHCHYCEGTVTWAEHAPYKNGYNYNLDRKNNNLGYSIENCVVCCWKCNETKRHLYSYEEFKVMITALNNWKKGGSCGS